MDVVTQGLEKKKATSKDLLHKLEKQQCLYSTVDCQSSVESLYLGWGGGDEIVLSILQGS